MESTSIGTEIVERIAAREGVDPVDLDVPLYEVIDADGLEALTNGTRDRQPQANLCVEFTYHGYAVTVDGRGKVIIAKQPTAAEMGDSLREESVDD